MTYWKARLKENDHMLELYMFAKMMARGVDTKWKTIANELLAVSIYKHVGVDGYTHIDGFLVAQCRLLASPRAFFEC